MTPSFALWMLYSTTAMAQQPPRVLDTDERRMLHDYLIAEARKHFDARRQAVAALRTPDDIQRRQQELKARFRSALGDFPEKTPLRPKVVGHLKGDGFRVEKVIYESRPDHHVTAVLYLPEARSPVPGVLVPCGHSANGKAAEPYQRACILLAKNGFAVLCYDPIGQGERIQLLDNQGRPAIKGSTSEHTMVGVGALLLGRNTASYRIWDGIRSLDYLASRPEVDAKRLGCTGNSGGGTLTAYLMALDDRILAAAPSCYITSLERLFDTIGPQDAEQNITGQVAFGMEHADYLTMRAPRPTLMLTATQDFFDIKGAWTTYREAHRLFGKLGHAERVGIFEYDDKHGFSKPRREAAMRFMRRFLMNRDDAPSENDFPVFTDAQLQCTRSGQVLEDFKGKSVFDLNRERGRQLRLAARRQASANLASRVEKLLGKQPRPGGIEKTKVSTEQRPGYQIAACIYHTEPGIKVPALEFIPNREATGPLVIYVHGDGMAAEAGKGGAIEKRVLDGQRVLAIDLRGMGETAPAGKGSHGPFGADWKEAFLALHLDRPLLGQRVFDLRSVLRATGAKEVHLVGVGAAGPIALHAAALDERAKELTLEKSLVSWSLLLEMGISQDQLANVIPGALRTYDLPDLAAMFAPRKLTIRDPVDALGRPIPRE